MLLRYIFYIFVFYIVMKILRMFFDPLFEKKENTSTNNNVNTPKPQKPVVGEYIDYEEIK